MIERLTRAERWLVHLEGLLIFLAFAGLVIAMLLQVFFRFVLASPLDFTEELTRIFMIWLVFIGGARALYMAEHFIVDVLVNNLPGTLRTLVGYLVDAVVIVFIAMIAWIGFRHSLFGPRQVMPALGVTSSAQTIAMPIGFAMMFCHACMMLLRRHPIGVPTPQQRDASMHEPVGS
ncbi:TRAP transporter small permease [Geminicoccus roseus]|uniref:TRAP transporter small permease n=1 Tax=Geminicoccus roseus TaxID=404900 RepID=UPI00041BB84D|nr:TRAP transporter small permease [Geminicoccus roseus]